MRRFFDLACRVFDEIRVTIDDAVESGDRVAARLTFRASAGGREIVMHGMGMATVRGGKIVEAWNLFDVASLLKQMRDPSQPATLHDALEALASALT